MRILISVLVLIGLSACGNSGGGSLPAADACNNLKQQVREQYGIPIKNGEICNECIAQDHWTYGYYPIPGTPVILTADFSINNAGQCQVSTAFSQ